MDKSPRAHLSEKEITELDHSRLRGDAFVKALSHLEICDECRQRVEPPQASDLARVFDESLTRLDSLEKPRGRDFFGFEQPFSATALTAFSFLVVALLAGYFISRSFLAAPGPEPAARLAIEQKSEEDKGSEAANLSAKNHKDHVKDQADQKETKQPTINEHAPESVALVNKTNRPLNSHQISHKGPAISRPAVSQHEHANQPAPVMTTEVASIGRSTNPQRVPLTTSETRGSRVAPKCAADPLAAEIETTPQQITFSWKKLEQAASYHLYISDDSQILLEEFETQSETSYVMKKHLERGKTYRWKIVAALADGRMVFGRSNLFTVGEKINKDLFQKTGKEVVRCIQ